MIKSSMTIQLLSYWVLLEFYLIPSLVKRWPKMSASLLYGVAIATLGYSEPVFYALGLIFGLFGWVLEVALELKVVSRPAYHVVVMLLLASLSLQFQYQINFLVEARFMMLFVLLAAAPVNVLFRGLFQQYHPEIEMGEDTSIEGAGAVIGILERLIMIIPLLNHQAAAIGLVFTAKSIARYDKISKNSAFAEYYLIGSLFSLLAVLLLHQAYLWLA